MCGTKNTNGVPVDLVVSASGPMTISRRFLHVSLRWPHVLSKTTLARPSQTLSPRKLSITFHLLNCFLWETITLTVLPNCLFILTTNTPCTVFLQLVAWIVGGNIIFVMIKKKRKKHLVRHTTLYWNKL